jgi:hypothetical protein
MESDRMQSVSLVVLEERDFPDKQNTPDKPQAKRVGYDPSLR